MLRRAEGSVLGKRQRPPQSDQGCRGGAKRARPGPETSIPVEDRLSPLSDELVLRVLSFLPISSLAKVALVSNRLSRLSSDSQIWRTLYYSRFVLPRALRIPGFRDGPRRNSRRLHYSSRRAVWADGGLGKRGGLVGIRNTDGDSQYVDWKQQYKLRHNWARGKATVEELNVGDAAASHGTLAKAVEGIAVTADAASGLRAWDLKTKQQMNQTILLDDDGGLSSPSSLALDDRLLGSQKLDICLGFLDGSFGVWRLDLGKKDISQLYKHPASSNGALIGVAYRHPFILTATESVLVSLYDFDGSLVGSDAGDAPVLPARKTTLSATGPETNKAPSDRAPAPAPAPVARKLDVGYDSEETIDGDTKMPSQELLAPLLVTSLKSHTSKAPLSLSIRNTVQSVVASIAYSYTTRGGWAIGIQELHIRQSPFQKSEVSSTRLAFTTPILSGLRSNTPPPTPPRNMDSSSEPSHFSSPPTRPALPLTNSGPTTICYAHPYLLATLPDNTLVLHVCTSSPTDLSVSPGIRLWGHTSGISDAEITARGKAVSVSSRGEEIRVWELEGRAGGRSIEVRQHSIPTEDASESDDQELRPAAVGREEGEEWDDRRSWVGFDDEMVIVLKEAGNGRESLVVYDFT